MFGIGIEELVVIFVIALFVLGPDRLPSLARDMGKAVRELRRASDELTEEFLKADQPRPEPPAPLPAPVETAPVEPAPAASQAPPATLEPESERTDTTSADPDGTTDFDRKAQEDADRARESGQLITPSSQVPPSEPERWG